MAVILGEPQCRYAVCRVHYVTHNETDASFCEISRIVRYGGIALEASRLYVGKASGLRSEATHASCVSVVTLAPIKFAA